VDTLNPKHARSHEHPLNPGVIRFQDFQPKAIAWARETKSTAFYRTRPHKRRLHAQIYRFDFSVLTKNFNPRQQDKKRPGKMPGQVQQGGAVS
jgi:hypothetical protein